jgi:hypothetical protein
VCWGFSRKAAAAHDLVHAPALHVGIEHLQSAAAGVDFVIMSEIREPFEDPEQVLVPGTMQDLHVAAAALRAERSEPRELVATLRTLNRYRAIIDPLIASHRGRIFNTAGDSLVADFASAVLDSPLEGSGFELPVPLPDCAARNPSSRRR